MPCRDLRGRAGRDHLGRGRSRHDPDREFGRAAASPISITSAAGYSGLFIVGEWFLPIRHQLMAPRGAKLADIKTVREPRPRARAMPPHHPQARAQAVCRGRHRRQRARYRRARRQTPCRDRLRGWRAEIYGLDIPAARCRGRDPQYHAFRGAGARGELGQAGVGAAGHHVCSPGAQPARRRSTRRWAASPPTAST